MKLIRLNIKNFLSFKSATINFRDSGLVLVDGWNYDDSTANGAGKSAVITSIPYALFGKLPKKIAVSEIPHQGTKSCTVSLDFQINTTNYSLTRTKPSHFSLFKDGELVTIDQEGLERLVGVSYVQYCLIVLCPQGVNSRFLGLSDTDKKDFLADLLDLSSIEDLREKTALIIKTLTDSMSAVERQIAQIEAKIQANKENIQHIPARLDSSTLLEQLSHLELVDLDLTHIDLEISALRERLQEALHINEQRTAIQHEIDKIDNMLEVLNEHEPECFVCPSCQASVVVGKTSVSTESMYRLKVRQRVENAKINRSTFCDKLNLLKVESTKNISSAIQELEQERTNFLRTHADRQRQRDNLTKQIKTIELHNSNIDAIAEQNSRIEKNIETLSSSLEILTSKSQIYKKRLDNLMCIKAVFSPTGLPAYILDNIVLTLNERIAHYLSSIWPNASFVINTYRETKQGETKAKFSEHLTISGVDRSLGALSGGEYRVLSLAVDLAIIDVFYMTSGSSWPLICLDEPFNGLDAANREKIMPMLSMAAVERELWIVDHATEFKALFLDSIFIEKRGGTSVVI